MQRASCLGKTRSETDADIFIFAAVDLALVRSTIRRDGKSAETM
jgi:hypothetical protein